MIWLYALCGILIFIAVLLFAGGFHLFCRICKRSPARENNFEAQFSDFDLSLELKNRLHSDYDWFDEHKTREVCTLSSDRLRLVATAVDAPKDKEARGVIILFHGYRSNPRREFCIQMRRLHEAGYHLIVTDQRAHGRSGGKYLCYGVKEAEDVISWRKEADNIYGNSLPIIFMGLSMGGATVLMASALVDKNDPRVRGVVADCPFSSPTQIISHVMKKYHKLPPQPLLSFANFWCRGLANFTLSAHSAAECLSRSHLCALLIHGTDDDFVPIGHSEKVVADSGGRARLVPIKNAPHAEAIYYDEELYMSELLSFISECIDPQDIAEAQENKDGNL